jgi:hypothetical protein
MRNRKCCIAKSGRLQTQVNARAFEAMVTKQIANSFYANALLEESYCKAVPQAIGTATMKGQSTSPCAVIEHVADVGSLDWVYRAPHFQK